MVALSCLLTLAASLSCVKMPRHASPAGEVSTRRDSSGEHGGAARVNINSATREELERLPGVGPSTAARVVEHRARYGPFRRAEHLLMVRGISDTRFRQLRPLIRVE